MKRIVGLAIPVALQSLLMSLLSLSDQLMVGQLGSSAVATTGIGAQLTMLVSVVVTSLATACSAYAAQYHATKRHDQLRGVVALAATAGMMLAAPLFLVGAISPQAVLCPFTQDLGLRTAGAGYIRCLALGMLPTALTIIATAMLRATGRVRIPLNAAVIAIVANLALDWILIFGHYGAPRLGLLGAGIGTLTARLLEFGIVAISLARELDLLGQWTWLPATTVRTITATALPQVGTELLWVLSENTYTAVYGRLGTQSLAAMAMTYPVQAMVFGLFGGLSAAAMPLLGASLGHQHHAQAMADARRLLRLGVGGATVAAVLVAGLAPWYVSLYTVTPETSALAVSVLRIFCLYLAVKVANMIISGGILPAGGDSRFQFLSETLATWTIGVPLALTGAFVLHLPLPVVYAMLSTEEVARFVIGTQRVRSGTWIRITTS
ncbi:MATE family efflux transporter [Luteococcus japonicus]|uniref:Probable multidrug resistance protein NorM n=1 Tax=Luteococcus japonicus LSP_Lj1 TaxID=1255658 RepID=A0A1R4INM2_9ACTN|nr:MATE family efflux transporter [Luteococcus japonicus]SJN21480.1 Na+-driven multidrug efflux pump [Luteococcus japonicus LSP_Lj1]